MVKDQGKYIVGSLVASKGQSKFTQLDTESLKLSVQELEAGKSLAVFNFFVISKRNLNGLYTVYSGSTTIPVFGDWLNWLGKKITAAKKRQELQGVKEKGIIGQAKKDSIRAKYEYAVKWSYLAAKQQLRDILDQWKRLTALEYTVTHLEPSEQDYGGLKPYVRARTTRLAFDKESRLDLIKRTLLRYVSNLEYDRAKIEGVDEEGNDRAINLLQMPAWFGELDYGKILGDSHLFMDDLSQCCLIKHLIQEANGRPEYFDIDVQ